MYRHVSGKCSHRSAEALEVEAPEADRAACEEKLMIDMGRLLSCLLRSHSAVRPGQWRRPRVPAHTDVVPGLVGGHPTRGAILQVPLPYHYGCDVFPGNERRLTTVSGWCSAECHSSAIDTEGDQALPALTTNQLEGTAGEVHLVDGWMRVDHGARLSGRFDSRCCAWLSRCPAALRNRLSTLHT